MNLLHFKDNTSNRDVISLFSGAMGLDIGLSKSWPQHRNWTKTLTLLVSQLCVQMDIRFWAVISVKSMKQLYWNRLD